MENGSISIAANDDATLEVARDVAKQSKTLAVLLASTDETRQKEAIRLPRFEASTLNIVFEWCEEHSGADTAHKDFSVIANYANEYARLKLTPWQADFFERYDPHWWELAVAASFLDVPYLTYSTCFAISESLRAREWNEEVPESVPYDVLCEVLRFFSHEDIVERGPLQDRWTRVIEENVRALPLEVVWADIKGDKIDVTTKEVFDDLDSLCRYADEKCLAFNQLSIRPFGEEEHAVVQAFLNQSSARPRVKGLDANKLPTKSPEAFRTCMSTLKELAERLSLLEEVWLDLSCDMHTECLLEEPGLLTFPACVQKLYINVYVDDDTKSFIGFVEALSTFWTRSLSIDFIDTVTDHFSILSKVYEKFASDAEIAPLRIMAGAGGRRTLTGLRQFAESRGFSLMTTGKKRREYEKKRGNDWKIAVKYLRQTKAITIKIKKVSE